MRILLNICAILFFLLTLMSVQAEPQPSLRNLSFEEFRRVCEEIEEENNQRRSPKIRVRPSGNMQVICPPMNETEALNCIHFNVSVTGSNYFEKQGGVAFLRDRIASNNQLRYQKALNYDYFDHPIIEVQAEPCQPEDACCQCRKVPLGRNTAPGMSYEFAVPTTPEMLSTCWDLLRTDLTATVLRIWLDNYLATSSRCSYLPLE